MDISNIIQAELVEKQSQKDGRVVGVINLLEHEDY